MKSFLSIWLISLFALSTLMLAGCGAGTGSSSPSNPSAQAYQLTVTAPPAGAGTITSSPAGINCPSTCSASFPQNTKVTLTATPGANYFFAGWGGACSGTTCVVTITAATSVSASFTAGEGVTVVMTGGGTGTTVTSSPAGINCPTTCSATFPKNTQVTLTETPGSDYFVGWGGNCSGAGTCSLTVSGAESVTAAFSAGDAVTVTMAGSGSGTVTSAPAGITCPGTCSATFPPNTSVTLSETATAPNVFSSWSGECTGTTVCSLTLSASTNAVIASFAVGGTLQSLNHIIILAQENRSLDSYFGYMRQYWANNKFPDQQFDGLPQFNQPDGINPPPGAVPSLVGCDPTNPNGADECTPDPSVTVPSFHMQSVCTESLSPFWNEAHADWNLSDPTSSTATLDGFVIAGANDARQYPKSSGPVHDINGYRTMGYFQDSDLPFYYYMASNFATSDRWFSPVMSRTQLNRMYIMAATSAGHAYPLGEGNTKNYPPGALPNTTIFEALQNAGITWKIYVDTDGTTCGTNPTASCLYNYSYINMFTYGQYVVDNLPQNLVPLSQFMTDVQNGTLPQVALIEPASSASLDEHPTDVDSEGGVDIQAGAQYVESLISALMYSQSWSDSAMIFTYDEDGGFYDHVPPQTAVAPDSLTSPIDLLLTDICDGVSPEPPICTFANTGYRVPMFVVSPFARKNYVSHTVYDTTAVLALIEKRFGLAPLTNRDKSQADMSTDFFDFVNVPWRTPPAQSSVPQQQTNGTCSLTAPTP